jgi:hypothetical protein
VSTNEASASWEAVAKGGGHLVAGAPAGRFMTSEAMSSSSIGLTHPGGSSLAHSSNSYGLGSEAAETTPLLEWSKGTTMLVSLSGLIRHLQRRR